jgi:hypothetical protein
MVIYIAALAYDTDFVYGQDGPMEARYTISNVTDLEGNVIGNRRADIKTVTIPGSSTSTYSDTTVINDNTFIYLIGTKSTVLVSGGIQQVVYENITVQQVVIDGHTYTEASITIEPIPGTDLAIVTITL